MYTIANFPDLASAQVAQSLLESADIMSVIPDESLAGIDWRMTTALHGIRLQISPGDTEAATTLLSTEVPELAEALFSSDEQNANLDEMCPVCGAGVVDVAPWKRRWKAATLLFPGLLLLWPLVAAVRPPLVCLSCGQGFREV